MQAGEARGDELQALGGESATPREGDARAPAEEAAPARCEEGQDGPGTPPAAGTPPRDSGAQVHAEAATPPPSRACFGDGANVCSAGVPCARALPRMRAWATQLAPRRQYPCALLTPRRGRLRR
jgi:hypothetical protein